MNQEKFGNFIKEIRKKNNLTQKEFADKFGITYQAVSKWERGLNLPDINILKDICTEYSISLDDILNGNSLNKNKKKGTKNLIIFLIVIFILIAVSIVLLYNKNSKNNDFHFKTLSSNCENFNISGSIAYNDKKSSIYISNIKYCGGNDITQYEEIECALYEANNDIEKKINSCNYNDEKNITLEEFLQTVTLTVDDYKKTCKEYSENSLFLSINAKDNNGKITAYKIPLTLENNCPN